MANCDYLIVDDDVSLCDVLQRALQRRGYSTVAAHTIAEALHLAEQHHPMRALVDLKLANESGLAVISSLKETLPEIHIVMLTGYASIATAVDAVKRGALNYLCKPVSTDEIIAAFITSTIDEIPPATLTPVPIDRIEWEHIQRVLHEHNGNISATARALGMHRRTLQRKLQKRPSPQ
jgi:two-component system, response regulator RegA